MKIVGFHHQTIVNVLIVFLIAFAVFWLKDGTPLVGLTLVQPTPVNAVPDGAEEEDDEREPAIGFTADID